MLNCGPGKNISAVQFADFGLPSGSCTTGFKTNISCHSDHANTIAAVEQACLHKQFCYLKASKTEFGDSCTGKCKQLAVQVNCSSGSGDKSMPLQPPLKCYTDEPANEPESSPRFTSATATSLAAFAGIPGSASGVLDLVPFLKARNGRRGPGHGLETSGWVTGFMLEGIFRVRPRIYAAAVTLALLNSDAACCWGTILLSACAMLQAIGDLSDDNLTFGSALSGADFAHATLTNAGCVQHS